MEKNKITYIHIRYSDILIFIILQKHINHTTKLKENKKLKQ
jgi:hypothetical protein